MNFEIKDINGKHCLVCGDKVRPFTILTKLTCDYVNTRSGEDDVDLYEDQYNEFLDILDRLGVKSPEDDVLVCISNGDIDDPFIASYNDACDGSLATKEGLDMVRFDDNGNVGAIGYYNDRISYVEFINLSEKDGIKYDDLMKEEYDRYNDKYNDKWLKEAYEILDKNHIHFDVDQSEFEFVDDKDVDKAYELLKPIYNGRSISTERFTLDIDERMGKANLIKYRLDNEQRAIHQSKDKGGR